LGESLVVFDDLVVVVIIKVFVKFNL